MIQYKRKTVLIASLIYVAIFLIYTFPLALHFSDGFLGDGDAHISVFNAYNFKHQLQTGGSIFFTDLMFHPFGESTLLHTNTFILSIFTNIFEDSYFGFNFYLLLSFVISGIGGFKIARYYKLSPVYAILSGGIFAFSSYKVNKFGYHYNLILTEFIPFLILSYLKIKDSSNNFNRLSNIKLRQVAGFILLFLLCCISDYITTIVTLYFIALNFIYFIAFRKINWSNINKWILWITPITLIVGIDQVVQGLKRAGFSDGGAFWFSGDLVSLFVPFKQMFFQWNSIQTWHKSVIGNSYGNDSNLFIGYTLIILFVILLFQIKKIKLDINQKSLLFCLVILFFFMFPSFKFAGTRLFYSPFSLQHFIPFLNNMRVPTRVVFLFVFLLSIFLFDTLPFIKNAKSNLLVILISLTLFIEFFPEKKSVNLSSNIPEVYTELGKKEGNVALILPFGVTDGKKKVGDFNMKDMSYLSTHKKKILGGHLSRLNENQFDLIKENAFLNKLIELQESSKDQHNANSKSEFLEEIKDFKDLNIDHVLINQTEIHTTSHYYITRILGNDYTKQKFKDGILYSTKTSN